MDARHHRVGLYMTVRRDVEAAAKSVKRGVGIGSVAERPEHAAPAFKDRERPGDALSRQGDRLYARPRPQACVQALALAPSLVVLHKPAAVATGYPERLGECRGAKAMQAADGC